MFCVNYSDTTSSAASPALPEDFRDAIDSMYEAQIRPELTISAIRPPQRPAPYSHAIGLEIVHDEGGNVCENSNDAFGRLILLYSPEPEEGWEGSMRLVAYIQADMDSEIAADPLLPDVAWQWLTESLENGPATFTNLGGTVTSTASIRFGEIGGPPRSHQLELRASWTAGGKDLSGHVTAFAKLLAQIAGLPPESVNALKIN